MNQVIITLCRQLSEEANAIIKYTEDIKSIRETNPKAVVLLEDIRLDELEHIQKLALALTQNLLAEETPEESKGDAE